MQVIPPYDRDFNAESNAERKFARLLTSVQGEDDAVAFHSFHLSRHRFQQMGEADFVVLWKGVVLVLEVKGGGLSRKDGKWYQRGRQGEHVLPKAPLDQAREARFAFSDLVAGSLPDQYPYGFALVTPDCMLEDGFEIGLHEYIGQKDMNAAGVQAKLDLMASVARKGPGRAPGDGRPRKDLAPLRKLMRRDLDGMMTLAHQTEFVERRRVELLADQIVFLEAAQSNIRIVLEGGAGTGKTLIALEGARREALTGGDVAFVCATKKARDVARRTIGASSVQLVVAEELPLANKVDLLVVDEAQDLMNTRDLDRVFNSVEGGLDNGHWWLLADVNNQAHVTGAYEADCYQLITSIGNCTRVRLPRNVRNTDPVIEATQMYLGADIGTARVGPGPAVVVEKVRDSVVAMSALRKRIEKMRHDGALPAQMAVVISGKGQDENSGEDDLIGQRIDGVHVWAAREIKGLEFAHVLVLGVDDLSYERDRNLAYVAMTRATVSLWMGVSDRAYGQMGAMAADYITRRRDVDVQR